MVISEFNTVRCMVAKVTCMKVSLARFALRRGTFLFGSSILILVCNSESRLRMTLLLVAGFKSIRKRGNALLLIRCKIFMT
jgi:hypothetical protein